MDEMIIHLFAEQSDATMSNIDMEVLSSGNPSVADLRMKIAETESLLCYKGGRRMGKQVQVKFCNPCNISNHLNLNVGVHVVHAVAKDIVLNDAGKK